MSSYKKTKLCQLNKNMPHTYAHTVLAPVFKPAVFNIIFPQETGDCLQALQHIRSHHGSNAMLTPTHAHTLHKVKKGDARFCGNLLEKHTYFSYCDDKVDSFHLIA